MSIWPRVEMEKDEAVTSGDTCIRSSPQIWQAPSVTLATNFRFCNVRLTIPIASSGTDPLARWPNSWITSNSGQMIAQTSRTQWTSASTKVPIIYIIHHHDMEWAYSHTNPNSPLTAQRLSLEHHQKKLSSPQPLLLRAPVDVELNSGDMQCSPMFRSWPSSTCLRNGVLRPSVRSNTSLLSRRYWTRNPIVQGRSSSAYWILRQREPNEQERVTTSSRTRAVQALRLLYGLWCERLLNTLLITVYLIITTNEPDMADTKIRLQIEKGQERKLGEWDYPEMTFLGRWQSTEWKLYDKFGGRGRFSTLRPHNQVTKQDVMVEE